MANHKTVKKAAKKATKKTARKSVTRTRPSKDSMYVSAKTGKAVTDSYAARNPTKVLLRNPPAPEDVVAGPFGVTTLEPYGGPITFEDPVFWAVVRRGFFGSGMVVALFTTRERAQKEADQLDQESGLSFNKYVVQRAPLNLDSEIEPVFSEYGEI